MAVLNKRYIWNRNELPLRYKFKNSGAVGVIDVRSVIDEINGLYKSNAGNDFFQEVDALVVGHPLLEINQGGGSAGTLGRRTWGKGTAVTNFKCDFGDKINIRHELLHVLGFEHEEYHKGYHRFMCIIHGKNPLTPIGKEIHIELRTEIEPTTLNTRIKSKITRTDKKDMYLFGPPLRRNTKNKLDRFKVDKNRPINSLDQQFLLMTTKQSQIVCSNTIDSNTVMHYGAFHGALTGISEVCKEKCAARLHGGIPTFNAINKQDSFTAKEKQWIKVYHALK